MVDPFLVGHLADSFEVKATARAIRSAKASSFSHPSGPTTTKPRRRRTSRRFPADGSGAHVERSEVVRARRVPGAGRAGPGTAPRSDPVYGAGEASPRAPSTRSGGS